MLEKRLMTAEHRLQNLEKSAWLQHVCQLQCQEDMLEEHLEAAKHMLWGSEELHSPSRWPLWWMHEITATLTQLEDMKLKQQQNWQPGETTTGAQGSPPPKDIQRIERLKRCKSACCKSEPKAYVI